MDTSKPYVLQVQNPTTGILNATLFDYNGNSSTIGGALTITAPSGIGNSYQRLLSQSQNKPFLIDLIRLQSANTSQLDQVVSVTYLDANGRQCSDPIPPIYRDCYQLQEGIIDIKYQIKTDGNTQLVIPIMPLTTLLILMWPKEIADASRPLIKQPLFKKFKTQRV